MYAVATARALTPRERQLVGLVLTGKCNKEIAGVIGATVRDVRFQMTNILAKFGVSVRIGLMAIVIREQKEHGQFIF
jgi:DNA-binding CsgD family transcriptional regulator